MDGLHHLHVRKRIYKRLEKYPHPVAWKRYYEYLMYGVAIVSPAALLPQVIELYRYQNASGLALPTFILLGAMNILWFFYGIMHREVPIFFSSALIAILNCSIVVGILLFR